MPIYGVLFGAVALAAMVHAWWAHQNTLALLEEALRRVSVEDRPQGPQYGADSQPAMRDLVQLVLKMDLTTVPDAHLLAIVLAGSTGRTHPLQVASRVLEQAGHNLDELSRMDASAVRGVGDAATARLQAMQELMQRRLARLEQDVSSSMTTPEQAARVIRTMTPDNQEAVIVLTLDRRSKLIGSKLVSIGSSGFTIVDPSIILREVISHPKAAGFIIGHNHPSGNTSPSDADISVTRRVETAARSLGIPLFDHIVTTKRHHTSLAERGYISSRRSGGPLMSQ